MNIQGDLKKKKLNKLLDFIASSFPGSGYTPNIGYREIFEILTSDTKIFLKIIPPLVISLTLMFSIQLIAYLFFGSSDCSGNPGPFIPGFFCLGDQRPILASLSRFFSTTFWFIVVAELMLLFFCVIGVLARSKYNVVIPKQLLFLFWLFIAGVLLTFFGFMVFG